MIIQRLYSRSTIVDHYLTVRRYLEITWESRWRLRKKSTVLQNGDWEIMIWVGPLRISVGIDSWYGIRSS